MFNSLWPHGVQHTRLPSLSPWACSNSCPSSQWCHPTISSSVVPFFCLQSFPASGSFPVSQLFTSGGQSPGASASASVLPMNIQGWFPLGWTGSISLLPQIGCGITKSAIPSDLRVWAGLSGRNVRTRISVGSHKQGAGFPGLSEQRKWRHLLHFLFIVYSCVFIAEFPPWVSLGACRKP